MARLEFFGKSIFLKVVSLRVWLIQVLRLVDDSGIVLLLLWTSAHAARRFPYFPVPGLENRVGRLPLQTQRAFNIAHRGSNGELPEETAEAYMVSKFLVSRASLLLGFRF